MSDSESSRFPKIIRLSIASAYVLGLAELKIQDKAKPTTCYIMEYHESGCSGSCRFCAQTSSHQMLSRVVWPEFEFSDFLIALEGTPKFGRYCIQCLLYNGYEKELLSIVSQIRNRVKAPISAAIGPLPTNILMQLKSAGLTDIGLSLDAATEPLFNEIKNNNCNLHSWKQIWECIDESIHIFGRTHVRTHIIVGLGEREKDVCEILESIHSKGIGVSLFPFMPIHGTPMESHPRLSLESYRKLQLFKYIFFADQITPSDVLFNEHGEIVRFRTISEESLKTLIMNKKRIFQTNGCSACNRPYYTSKPGEVQYDYPYSPEQKELDQIFELIKKYSKSN